MRAFVCGFKCQNSRAKIATGIARQRRHSEAATCGLYSQRYFHFILLLLLFVNIFDNLTCARERENNVTSSVQLQLTANWRAETCLSMCLKYETEQFLASLLTLRVWFNSFLQLPSSPPIFVWRSETECIELKWINFLPRDWILSLYSKFKGGLRMGKLIVYRCTINKLQWVFCVRV